MKKRFLFLFVGLNLLLISSVSMSIAWFLGSLRLTIDGIVINIDVDADLKISKDDNLDNARDSLTEADLGKIESFVPVSSMGSEKSEWISNASEDKDYKPIFKAQYKTGYKPKPIAKDATSGYFSRTLYLFSTHDMLVTFDSEKTTITPNTRLNSSKALEKANEKAILNFKEVADERIADLGVVDESEKQTIYEQVKAELVVRYANEITDSLNRIEDSLRISILDYDTVNKNNYTIIDPKKSEDHVVFGGRLSTSIRKDYFDYYSDYPDLKETLFGDYTYLDPDNEDLPYLPAVTEDKPAEEGEHTCFNAGTRKGVRPLDVDNLDKYVRFATEQSISPEVADVSKHPDNEEEGYLIRLTPNEPHKLILSVYLEGWDRDNVDATQEAAFNMSIHFRLLKQGDFR